jgi:ribosome-binding protein aMBF1 (putative translation factor)
MENETGTGQQMTEEYHRVKKLEHLVEKLNHSIDLATIATETLRYESLAHQANCKVLCNALQRIEYGELEPRMIARRALETAAVKSTGEPHDR